jgi:membrane protein DedA with SNARE-associated domain
MKMGLGMWVMILGILGIIIGGAMYAYPYHKTIGMYGAVLGVILLILGAVWWMMKERSPAKPATPQPAQPAKTS